VAEKITSSGVGIRFFAAAVLVFCTYNPEGVSYYHWISGSLEEISVLQIFVGVVLLIGWAIYIRATLNSLGAIGLILALAFFGTLAWLVVDLQIVPADSVRSVTYLILVALCGVLTAGVSWSHIRRRITGQVDVDDLEGD
jgi:hypothetical protein